MDIRLYSRILWRFRILVAVGFVLAILLAGLSVVTVSFVNGTPTLTYRTPEVWQARETLLISEHGFPEGRTIFPMKQTRNGAFSRYADPGRLAGLAGYYARLANSDTVRSRIPVNRRALRPGKLASLLTATPLTSTVGNQALPMLTISAKWKTSRGAIHLARSASTAFRNYLVHRQVKAGVPVNQRVIVSVLDKAAVAKVIQPHKKTTPILVFAAILAATFGLALILEKVRPRSRVAEVPELVQEVAFATRAAQATSVVGVGRADAGN